MMGADRDRQMDRSVAPATRVHSSLSDAGNSWLNLVIWSVLCSTSLSSSSHLSLPAILLRRPASRWRASSSFRSGSIWLTTRSGLQSSRPLNFRPPPLLQPSPSRRLPARLPPPRSTPFPPSPPSSLALSPPSPPPPPPPAPPPP